MVFAFLSMAFITCSGQTITNVHFETSDKQIVVSYDLSGKASSGYSISLYFTISDGPWQGPVKSVTGNVGLGQKSGNGKKITWNVLGDIDKLTGEISVKVQAEVLNVSGSNDTNGTFTDFRDGRTYKVVKIRKQTWMAENLAWLPFVSPSNTSSEKENFYYVYGYEGTNVSAAKSTANYTTYGVLYNRAASLVACPFGWHLPNDAEWKILEKNQGMSQSDADATDWRNSGTVGGKLKEAGTSHWIFPNTGATNSCGFTALPGGNRIYLGGFRYLGLNAYFWSASESGALNAWYRYLYYDNAGVYRYYSSRSNGFSVRCLQN